MFINFHAEHTVQAMTYFAALNPDMHTDLSIFPLVQSISPYVLCSKLLVAAVDSHLTLTA